METATKKRIFGNIIVGVWYDPTTKMTYMPSYLRDNSNKFNWKASNPQYPNNLYPHSGEVPLKYDEEA